MARIAAAMKLVMGCAVGLALVAAACAGKSSSAAGPTTPATTPATSPSATSTSGGGGYGGGYGGKTTGGSGTGTATATLQQGPGGQYVFSPTKLTVTKGQTIDVKNVGSIPHTFTITGKGIDVVNQAGQSQNVVIKLAPGTYTFICRFHQSLGMQGTLIVKG